MEIIGLLLILALYFLPSIIGYSHRNFGSIFLLNLLLGWTAIGWIIAIIWSVSDDKRENKNTIIKNNSISYELLNLKQLYEDGTLTKEEFETEKKYLLRK